MSSPRRFPVFGIVKCRFIGSSRGNTIAGTVTKIVRDSDRIEIYAGERKPAFVFKEGNSASWLDRKGNIKVFIPSADAAFTIYGVDMRA